MGLNTIQLLSRRRLLTFSLLATAANAQTSLFSGAPAGWALVDGSLNAPTGTANLPTALNPYSAHRPPWHVAGIDYRVGISTGVTLKNPRTDTLPSGCTRDTVNRNFFVDSNSVTVNGWDFSEGGGWTCDVRAANTTVTNNDFSGGLLKFEPTASHGPAIVRYNKFDQLGLASTVGELLWFADGLITIEYNYFTRAWPMPVQLTNGNGSSMAIVMRYNLFNNAGLGSPVDGSHGDHPLQIFGSNFFVSSMDLSFNAVIQSLPAAQAATQGWSIQGSADVTEIRSTSIAYNTTIIDSAANVNYIFLFDTTWINGSCVLSNNYTAKGPATFLLTSNSSADGPYSGTVTEINNIDLNTGNVMT